MLGPSILNSLILEDWLSSKTLTISPKAAWSFIGLLLKSIGVKGSVTKYEPNLVSLNKTVLDKIGDIPAKLIPPTLPSVINSFKEVIVPEELVS